MWNIQPFGFEFLVGHRAGMRQETADVLSRLQKKCGYETSLVGEDAILLLRSERYSTGELCELQNMNTNTYNTVEADNRFTAYLPELSALVDYSLASDSDV